MDECQTGAAYSQICRRKVVHMRRKSSGDAPKDFELANMTNFLPHLQINFLVLPNHFRSSLITNPNRFTSVAPVKSSSPIVRSAITDVLLLARVLWERGLMKE